MKISIIIPVLNEAAVICSTLEKTLSLDADCETIVVDGGSTDGTFARAQRRAEDHAGRVLVLESPGGRAIQMNLGARHSKGDVLLFLHADTILPEEAAREIAECLKDPRVVGGRFRLRLDQPGWRYWMIASSINLRDRLFRGFTGDQAIFIRRDVFDSIGGYEEIPLMEDLAMARRMCRSGKVVQLRSCVITSARRWQRSGVFRTILLMWQLRLMYVFGFSPSRLKRLYGDVR